MPAFTINPKELGRILTEDHARMVEASVRAIQTTVALHGPRIAQAVVASANPPPVDRGTYRRSFKAQKVANGAVFYNFAPYASIIEEGRRKGAKMPPVDVILAWVKRKRIGATLVGPVMAARGGSTRFVRKTSQGTRTSSARKPGARRLAIEAQQKGIALAIARSIGRRGLPAHHVLAITEATLTPLVEDAIDLALAKV